MWKYTMTRRRNIPHWQMYSNENQRTFSHSFSFHFSFVSLVVQQTLTHNLHFGVLLLGLYADALLLLAAALRMLEYFAVKFTLLCKITIWHHVLPMAATIPTKFKCDPCKCVRASSRRQKCTQQNSWISFKF